MAVYVAIMLNDDATEIRAAIIESTEERAKEQMLAYMRQATHWIPEELAELNDWNSACDYIRGENNIGQLLVTKVLEI